MKGITGNPALDAYQRMSAVTPTHAVGKPARSDAARSSAEAATVTISREARDLAAAGESEVSSQRVEELKAAVQNGTFRVDARLVAEKILDEVG